jgi:hypothetical protein
MEKKWSNSTQPETLSQLVDRWRVKKALFWNVPRISQENGRKIVANSVFGFRLTIQNTANRHASNAFDLIAVFISFPWRAAAAAGFRYCCCAPPPHPAPSILGEGSTKKKKNRLWRRGLALGHAGLCVGEVKVAFAKSRPRFAKKRNEKMRLHNEKHARAKAPHSEASASPRVPPCSEESVSIKVPLSEVPLSFAPRSEGSVSSGALLSGTPTPRGTILSAASEPRIEANRTPSLSATSSTRTAPSA